MAMVAYCFLEIFLPPPPPPPVRRPSAAGDDAHAAADAAMARNGSFSLAHPQGLSHGGGAGVGSVSTPNAAVVVGISAPPGVVKTLSSSHGPRDTSPAAAATAPKRIKVRRAQPADGAAARWTPPFIVVPLRSFSLACPRPSAPVPGQSSAW